MAQIANPRKNFNFDIDFGVLGLDSFLAQKVNIPDRDTEIVEHGDLNHSIKTAGRVSYGNVTIEKIMTTNPQGLHGDATVMWNWAEECQDSIAGGGSPPSMYKKTLSVIEYAENGIDMLNVWWLVDCWPTKVGGISLDRTTSENTIESIELAVDHIVKMGVSGNAPSPSNPRG